MVARRPACLRTGRIGRTKRSGGWRPSSFSQPRGWWSFLLLSLATSSGGAACARSCHAANERRAGNQASGARASSSADSPEALPSLNESDAPLQTAIGKVFGADAAQKFLIPDGLVRRIVVTVDNLPRQKVAVEKRPLKALDGETLVHTEADLTMLSDANYARYALFVKLLDKSDMQQLANLYFNYYSNT